MTKKFSLIILIIPLLLFAVSIIFDYQKPATSVSDNQVVREDIPLDTHLNKGEKEAEEKSPAIQPTEEIIIETEEQTETKPEISKELPDIIKLEVKIYNENSENYNTVDGKKYLDDITMYLEKYVPKGMYFSAASAMAYTEGGSGKKGIYRSTNNCFGIRATSSWEGYVYARSTGKVYKDYKTAQKYGASDFFRAYDNMEESVKDYVNLISGDYYKEALNKNSPKEYLKCILDKGYGESSLLNMWLGVINIYDLRKFDK